ncbi:helix-hairpin-helix domain-containing protein [bacterium]|nr:helix-hairpin-helix domain-containing protein [bacterium]
MGKTVLSIFIIIIPINVIASNLPDEPDEIYLWQESSWMENEDWEQELWNYEVNPVNVNTASRDEIAKLPGIENSESLVIVQIRDSEGTYKDKNDLIKRTGISAEIINAVSGFLRFDQQPFEARIHVRANRRYGEQADADMKTYNGSPYGLTERVWLKTDTWKAGFLLDKAKYEPEIADQNKFYIEYSNDKQKTKLIAGDFNISSGLGLVLMTKPAYFDGFDSSTPYIMRLTAIAPAVETAENSSFRGIATSTGVADLSINVFAARTELDAIMNDEGDVLRLSDGGMHRSEIEAKKNNTVTETALGGSVSYNIELENDACLTPFVTGYTAKLDPPLQPVLEDRNHFQLAGDRNTGYGAGCGFEKGNLSAGGEVGYDIDGEAAWKAVLSQRNISNYKWTYRLTAFHYPPGYDNYRAGSPVSGADPANSEGVAILVSGKCNFGIVKRLKSHLEVERRPWRTYTVPIAFTSSRGSIEAGCPFDDTELRIRYRRYNGYDGHGEAAEPSKFNDDRLRLWWRSEFPEYKLIDYCRMWIEGAYRNDSEKGEYFSNGGGVSVKGKLAMLGGWKVGYGVSCSIFSAQTILPVYSGESSLPDRFASVRLSGNGMRWAGSLVLKRSRYNWFGLMAARTFQLGGNKASGDTEVYVTYSYNFKAGS